MGGVRDPLDFKTASSVDLTQVSDDGRTSPTALEVAVEVETEGGIEEEVKNFIIERILSPLQPGELNFKTDLLENRILDSVNVLIVVDHIEQTYDIMLEPQELVLLTTIQNISQIIRSKFAH